MFHSNFREQIKSYLEPTFRIRNCSMYRKGRFYSVSAGLTRMPSLNSNTLRIRSL